MFFEINIPQSIVRIIIIFSFRRQDCFLCIINCLNPIFVFIESIRGTLAGDRTALERNYQLTLGGNIDQWTLRLVPLDEKMRAVVQRIRIAGVRDAIRRIEIFQTDGDSSLMLIEKLTP